MFKTKCACCGAPITEFVRVARAYCSPGCREAAE